ncbi:hypothetical protein RHMOL_Rhmol13G0172900 [Rhododendron molle]|uniref:Uncharacterized protein n=1 Tax=Rhododendron molle TaxID=49168 RepID=A0ACC0L7R8_RHOML|nr:hypothetical protein RHMOL_Rhmol13G0172900 [Rhododendron molle]
MLRLKLLSTLCFIVLGLEPFGLAVESPFGLLVWASLQLLDGWRTFYVDKWQRKLQWRIWQLFSRCVGLFAKLDMPMISPKRPQSLEILLKLLLWVSGITSMHSPRFLNPIPPVAPRRHPNLA